MTVLEDLYSLQQTCVPERKEVKMEKLLMQNHSKCKVAEQLSLPEIKCTHPADLPQQRQDPAGEYTYYRGRASDRRRAACRVPLHQGR